MGCYDYEYALDLKNIGTYSTTFLEKENKDLKNVNVRY